MNDPKLPVVQAIAGLSETAAAVQWRTPEQAIIEALEEEKADAQRRIDELESALRELVALKDLLDSVPDDLQVTDINAHEKHGPRYAEYKRRKPLAWAAARAAIAAESREGADSEGGSHA
jgi:hypothetical protein